MSYLDRERRRTQITVGGKRKSTTFPAGTPKKVVDEYEYKIRLGKIDGSLGRESPTLRAYHERFLKVYPTIKKRGDAMKLKDRSTLKWHLLPAFGDMPLRSITAGQILDFQASLYQDGEGLAPQTCGNVLSCLSAIFRLAVLERLVDYNPCSAVPRIPVEQRLPTFWTPAEADQFLVHCREHDYELFQLCVFALNTGMRPGELQGLKRDCLVFEAGYVDIRRNWCTKTNRVNEFTKNKLNRKVSVPAAVWQVMANKYRLAPDELVFPFDFNSIGFRRIRPMAEAARVKVIRFHDLRHTFASHLVLHGKHPVEIKELMGHKKLSSTDIYMHLVDDLRKGATDCLTKGMSWAVSKDTKVVNLDGSRH